MNDIETLKKRSEFLALRSAKRFHSQSFILQTLRRQTNGTPRVGYTVTTKTGNAVVRNRIKRRLREAVRSTFPAKAKHNHDYVLIGKREAINQKFDRIVNDLNRALDHVHKIGAKPTRKHGKSDSPQLNKPKQRKSTDLS